VKVSQLKKYLPWYLPIITGIWIIAAWSGVKAVFGIRNFVLPGPFLIAKAAVHEHDILIHGALVTMAGASLGFLLAAVVGFLMSIVMGMSTAFRMSLYPYILILQMTPVVIFAPVLVIWLGPGLPAISAITFLICFFPIVANMTQGLISVDKNMVDLFRMINASKWQEVVLLRVPHALPYFLTGLRIAGSIAMIGGTTGDIFAGNSAGGLGYLVLVYDASLQIPELWAAGLMACFCGFIFVSIVLVFNWVLLRKWHDSIVKYDQ
jgi:NitT/TauT family transport system permease protein